MDAIFIPFILLLAFSIKNRYPFSEREKTVINWVYLFHFIVCISSVWLFYTGGDAKAYWLFPKAMTYEQVWGNFVSNPRPTQFLDLINYFPTNVLGLSFFSGMIIYSFFGFWAFLLIMLTIKEFIPDLSQLQGVKLMGLPVYPFVFFLPNMHFWSVAIGKDSVLFFSVSAILYALANVKKRWLYLVFAAAAGYYLRPHVLLFLAAGYGMAYILSTKLNLFQKILFASVASVIFFPLLNNVLDFARIEELSTEHLDDFSSSKSAALSKAGSGIDMSNYPYPLKVLTFLFRPFFFDVNGIPAVIASVENLIQVFFFYFFLKNKSLKFIVKANLIIRTSFFYFVIGALAFAPVMGNLGIIIREKNMLMPAFLIFILASVKYKMNTIKYNGAN